MTPLTTDVQLAELLGVSVEDVHLKTRPGGPWPCVKPKRGVWRFTEAMVAQIIDLETVTPTRPAVITARSTRRRSA